MKISEARLFVDDYLLYRHIRHDQDSSGLQISLPLKTMKENGKCISIQKNAQWLVCTYKRLKNDTAYQLHGHVLDSVDCSQSLGVNISEDLTWKKHVDHTDAKVPRTLGFFRRNLRDCRKGVRAAAYNAMVQSVLDNASTSWDQYTKDVINTLEKVQHRGARFVCNNYTDRTPGCVTTMLESLDSPDNEKV